MEKMVLKGQKHIFDQLNLTDNDKTISAKNIITLNTSAESTLL